MPDVCGMPYGRRQVYGTGNRDNKKTRYYKTEMIMSAGYSKRRFESPLACGTSASTMHT